MSTLRLEPARVGTLSARHGQGRWYGFDVQLAIYALSLTVIGLVLVAAVGFSLRADRREDTIEIPEDHSEHPDPHPHER